MHSIPNLKNFLICIICALFVLACNKTPEPHTGNADHQQEPEIVSDWTAGIVSGSPRIPSGTCSVVQDVRTARHEGFDRIVFEFGDPGIPGFHIEYVDEPVRECASGYSVHLPGEGWLMIRFSAARMHQDGAATIENRDFDPKLPVVLRLATTCDFENLVTWIAAVSTPNKFKVLALTNPSRLVIDIRHQP